MVKCPNCDKEAREEDNFCTQCRSKLRSTCKCWVLKKDNYDCGESSCPGWDLYKKLLKNKRLE